MKQFMLFLCVSLTMASCTQLENLVKSDELPVKYMVCNDVYEDCSLEAQFNDMDSCEYHRELSAADCNWESEPGKIICDIRPETAAPTGTKAICTYYKNLNCLKLEFDLDTQNRVQEKALRDAAVAYLREKVPRLKIDCLCEEDWLVVNVTLGGEARFNGTLRSDLYRWADIHTDKIEFSGPPGSEQFVVQQTLQLMLSGIVTTYYRASTD